MMRSNYLLSLDESGESNVKTFKRSPIFVLSGCIFDLNKINKFKEHLNQIKFSVWKDEWSDVFLRSCDLGRGYGSFSKFYDRNKGKSLPNKEMEKFCKDMKEFYRKQYFSLISCIVNKEQAFNKKRVKSGNKKKTVKYFWESSFVLKICYEAVLKNFLMYLILKNSKGKIIAEASSIAQDIILYKVFFSLQSQGLPSYGISHKEVKKRLTSLSFVTKKNMDSEEEIADAMGYAGKISFLLKNKKITQNGLNIYDTMILEAYRRNLLNVTPKTKETRLKKISKNINSLIIFP